MNQQRPDVVVLAAATVGGIEANRSRPADFLLQNLRIAQVIEAAWRAGRGGYFLVAAVFTQNSQRSQFERRNFYRCARTDQCLVCDSKNRGNQTRRSTTAATRV